MTQRNWRVTFRNREVHNPVARILVSTFVLVTAPVALLFAIASLLIILPLSLPWHFLIRLCGGRGFTSREDGKLSYNVPWWGVLLSLAPIALLVSA